MNNHKQKRFVHPTDGPPALLSIVDTIRLEEHERIEEDPRRVLKCDTVLDEICVGFVWIPLEVFRHTMMLLQICCQWSKELMNLMVIHAHRTRHRKIYLEDQSERLPHLGTIAQRNPLTKGPA